MWLLAIPVGLILLLLLLGAGLIALIVGAVKSMPVLLVLLGAWLLLRPSKHRGWDRQPRGWRHSERWDRGWEQPRNRKQAPRSARPGPAVQPIAASAPSAQRVQYRALQPRPQTAPRRELPIDVQVRAEQIRRKADMLLGYADRFPPFSQDLYLVRQTTADYLPRTTAAYLALPGTDDPVVAATGKTALQELRAQLQLLDAKLDEITQDLQRQDLDHLLANRRFLEERFRMRDADRPSGPAGEATDAA